MRPLFIETFLHFYANGLQLRGIEFACLRPQVIDADFILIDFREQGFLGELIFILLTSAALQHPPRFPTLHSEENHLSGDQEETDLTIHLSLDVDTKVRDIAAMIFFEDISLNDIELRDARQHLIDVNELGDFFLFDRP